MSFLSPILLAMAAFAAIPVLLHLIKRKRVRILDFPTFRFLKQAAMEQRFHLRLQDQLLMLLRIFILLLLALAFAGPLTERNPPQDSAFFGQENILVIDNSLSMNVLDEDRPLQEWALDWAEWILDSHFASWKVILATDLLQSDPLAHAVSDSSSLRDRLSSSGPPAWRGPLSHLLEGFRKSLNEKIPLWVLSDRTAANWRGLLDESAPSLFPPLDVLTVGPGVEIPNSALHPLHIRNEPLLPDEPAHAAWIAETFGPGDPKPLRIQSVARHEDGTVTRQGWNLAADSSQSRFEHLFPGNPVVQSISASLVFPPEVGDPLPQDDTGFLEPRIIEGFNGLLLAHPSRERDLLLAALHGLPFTSVDLKSPLSSQPQANPMVVVLSDQPVAPEWKQMIDARVRAGGGLLVFYDRHADGARQQAWSQWWQAWSSQGESLSVPGGEYRFMAGVSAWFADRLDPSALDPSWTQRSFPLYRLADWPIEWMAASSSGENFPLLQVKNIGEGVIATWNVPLSVDENSLSLSPGWVPLLFQMIKRILISGEERADKMTPASSILESDLRSLSEDEITHLAGSGCRIHAIEEFAPAMKSLPANQFDWTWILLLICLFLALVEIGLSNYL